MTGAEALKTATTRLKQAGIEDAGRDARWLLSHALGLPPAKLILHSDHCLTDQESAAFETMLVAREARQPVSQIIGRREFWGRDFRVTPDVLDPRADTETLISVALEGKFNTVLDLGTGSGAILVTLLAERCDAQGVGTDLSLAALAVAKENAETHGVAPRAVFVESDWFKFVDSQFDLIVSNPPYIAASEMKDLQPEVRLWEPELALTDQTDGLSAYRRILEGACKHLSQAGRLIVEIGHRQGADVIALFQRAGLGDISIHTDLDGRDRVVVGKKV